MVCCSVPTFCCRFLLLPVVANKLQNHVLGCPEKSRSPSTKIREKPCKTQFCLDLLRFDLMGGQEEGVEPTQSKAPADFESAASASSATPGY
jgi:hypothetical protein